MVERAIMSMLEGMASMLARSGMDPRTANLDWRRLREDFRPRAESEVRGRLLFEAVARQEKIEVSDEDFEKKLESLSEESHNPLSQVRKAYREPKSRDALLSQIREEKTIAFLKSAATYS
jgi:trigger factor